MAVDKLVDSTQLDADLTSVANAIRTKGGTSADLAFPSGFVSAVEAIPTGGGSIPEFEVTAASNTTTLSFSVGSFVFPSNYAVFLKSDVNSGDGVAILIKCFFFCKTNVIPLSKTNTYQLYNLNVYLANGNLDYYTTAAPTITQNGSVLNITSGTNARYYKAGATYTIQIYELDSQFV